MLPAAGASGRRCAALARGLPGAKGDVGYPPVPACGREYAEPVTDPFESVIERFILASAGFENTLRMVRPGQWAWPTPCAEWNVRKLVNHMAQGNLNYVRLLHGSTGAEFMRFRDADALAGDPAGAYCRSVRECAEAFAQPGALQQILDYPLGQVAGRQALAVRTVDSAIHTWDLARAIGADDELDAILVAWTDDHLEAIYSGLAEAPASAGSAHRFFAAPKGGLPPGSSRQHRLLRRMGREP